MGLLRWKRSDFEVCFPGKVIKEEPGLLAVQELDAERNLDVVSWAANAELRQMSRLQASKSNQQNQQYRRAGRYKPPDCERLISDFMVQGLSEVGWLSGVCWTATAAVGCRSFILDDQRPMTNDR